MEFHHIAFTVKDIKKSAQWYEDKLGFKVVHEYKNNNFEQVLLELSNIKLELISFGKDTEKLPDYRLDVIKDIHTVGTKHLCIEVDNLEESIKNLKAKGVDFVMNIDTAAFGGRYIFFKDNEGILIELYQA